MGVCPMNKKELVDGLLEKLTGVTDLEEDLQLQLLNEKHTSNGKRIKNFAFNSCLSVHLFLFVQASLGRGIVTKKFRLAL